MEEWLNLSILTATSSVELASTITSCRDSPPDVLNGYEQLPRAIEGVKFTDGIQADKAETRAAT